MNQSTGRGGRHVFGATMDPEKATDAKRLHASQTIAAVLKGQMSLRKHDHIFNSKGWDICAIENSVLNAA
jgi:hypothetical protein